MLCATMATPRSMSDVALQGESTLPDRFNPCITDTFLDIPSAEIVVVPWKVFQIFPEIMYPNFSTESRLITYDNNINIFMSNPILQPSNLGHLEEFTQSWVVPVTTVEELDEISVRLGSCPSLLSVILTARNLLEDSIEVPVVVFISPESQCIRDLVSKLGRVKENFSSNKKFSIEVDIGPAMVKWGKNVLKREFLSVGGRFCITNGAMFNHVLDWNNILGCVPCLPCGVIGSSVYRLHRKINYTDEILNDMVGVVTLGAKGMATSNQQHAVYLLMQWIRVFKMFYCIECRKRVPTNERQKGNPTFCRCEELHKTSSSFRMRNKVAPSPLENSQTSTEGLQEESEVLATSDSTGHSKGETSADTETASPDRTISDNTDKADEPLNDGVRPSDGAKSYNRNSETKEQIQSKGVHRSHSPSKLSKKNGTSSRSKQQAKQVDGTDHRFAPYKAVQAGQSIDRKKLMLAQNPGVTEPEYETAMDVLCKKYPGGYVPMRTLFKYPSKKSNKKPARRPRSSGFVEIELKAAEDNVGFEATAGTTEISMQQDETRLDGEDEVDYDDNGNGFYFLQDRVESQFDKDPLAQKDLKRFLVHISDPKTGTLHTNGSGNQPITRQPTRYTSDSYGETSA